MNIVICGVGKFGKELVEHLVNEGHNITVIDTVKEYVDEMVNQYDIMGCYGNAASYNTLKEAGVDKADLLIATTPTDERNILCCLVAKKVGVKQTIARIRDPEFSSQTTLFGEDLGVDLSLTPDLDTAKEIFRILRFPSANKVETFANGRVELVETKVTKDCLLCDKSLMDIRMKYQVNVLVCAVKRENDVLIPNGTFVLKEGDYVYLTADNKEIEESFRKLNIFKDKLNSTMIIGSSKISYYLTNMLTEKGVSVKIIERDADKCKTTSQQLPKALVLHGDGTNQKILLEEGLNTIDSLVTLTGLDETNIIVSTFGVSYNVDKVITKVNNYNYYESILSHVGLDSVVSPKSIFCSHVLRYVRSQESTKGSVFKSLYRLVGNKVEALEFVISEKTKYTSVPLKDLKFKQNNLLACIIRNNEVIIPGGRTTLEPNDSVVIVTTNTKINDVSDILE